MLLSDKYRNSFGKSKFFFVCNDVSMDFNPDLPQFVDECKAESRHEVGSSLSCFVQSRQDQDSEILNIMVALEAACEDHIFLVANFLPCSGYDCI